MHCRGLCAVSLTPALFLCITAVTIFELASSFAKQLLIYATQAATCISTNTWVFFGNPSGLKTGKTGNLFWEETQT